MRLMIKVCLKQLLAGGGVKIMTSKNLAYKTQPWRYIYRFYGALRELDFPNLRAGGDVPFGICANALGEKIAYVKDVKYFYRNRIGSLSKKTENPKQDSTNYDFAGFKFIYEFLKSKNLLSKYKLPTDMITKPLSFLRENPKYFYELQSLIRSWHTTLSPKERKINPIFDIILESKTPQEYFKKSIPLRDFIKYNFRIKLNKHEKFIKLFGKILYNPEHNVKNKWNS